MLAAPRCAVLSLADENFNLFLTPWEPGGAGSRVSTHYNLPQLETKLRKVFTITVKAAFTRDLSWLKAATGTFTFKNLLRLNRHWVCCHEFGYWVANVCPLYFCIVIPISNLLTTYSGLTLV